jgi:hypothetical protein
VVLAVVLPEVPVTVTVNAPVVPVLLAVSVSTLELVEDAGLNEAVTPLGSPEAANETLPVNPPVSVTVIVSVPLLPWLTDRVDTEGLRVKPDVVLGLTVSAIVVLAVVLPEVPLMVTVDEPTVAVLLAVNVTTLLPVVGLVPNAAVTPLGKPEAASVTLPVNPPSSVTETVSVAVLPCITDRLDGDGVSVKPGVAVPDDTNVVILCAGRVYVNVPPDTLTALSCAN